jgi:NitT/TauT family transport system substrate-binding protein
MQPVQNRRHFLTNLSAAALAVTTALRQARAEPAPETTSVRFGAENVICTGPQYIAEELLRAEGFSEFENVPASYGIARSESLARGDIDFSIDFATAFVIPIDAGAPIKVISGVHAGCYQLFVRDGIRSIKDLKGRKVGCDAADQISYPLMFLSVIATYIGLDPRDFEWVFGGPELFTEGKVDAFLAFPPEDQDLRASKIGYVVLDSATDRPWSQYYCCMLAVNAVYAAKYPVATKRVVRAILKSADICATEPERVARLLVDSGRTSHYEYAVQALRQIPYRNWRDYDPEDAVRFFSLRLNEAGIVKLSPHEIIANGTDWRFFNEIKRELKG